MKSRIVTAAVALVLAGASLGANALGRNEKGCLVGGVGGGVAGHFLGDHPVLGAAAGCAIGNYVARDQAKKEREAAAKKRHKVARDNNNHRNRPAPPPQASERERPAG